MIPKLAVRREPGQRLRDGPWVSFRDKEAGAAFQEFRNPSRVRGNDRNSRCHRLNEEHRNSFPAFTCLDTGEKCHIPLMIPELGQKLLMVEESQELYAIQEAECASILLDRRLQRTVPCTLEQHVYADCLEPSDGLQCVTMALELVEASSQQNSERASRPPLSLGTRRVKDNAHVNDAHLMLMRSREGYASS